MADLGGYAGPGAVVYHAPIPRCPEHGRMQPDSDPERDRWVCHGWDGEGCAHVVANADLAWSKVGTVA